jgi:hypothetical protein
VYNSALALVSPVLSQLSPTLSQLSHVFPVWVVGFVFFTPSHGMCCGGMDCSDTRTREGVRLNADIDSTTLENYSTKISQLHYTVPSLVLISDQNQTDNGWGLVGE